MIGHPLKLVCKDVITGDVFDVGLIAFVDSDVTKDFIVEPELFCKTGHDPVIGL